MPWMRVAIGAGGVALLAGVVGMVAWIDDGSHYFEMAVAVGSAGFLTLVACVLTQVFGSSHGSQDDAFRRGKSMGYDEGFLEGHRTARPVVVPIGVFGRDREISVGTLDPDSDDPDSDMNPVSDLNSVSDANPVSHVNPVSDLNLVTDLERVDEVWTPPNSMPGWDRDALPPTPLGAGDRVLSWMRDRRTPITVGALCLGLVGILVANAFAPVPMPTALALQPSPDTQSNQAEPPSRGTGGWETTSGDPAIPSGAVPHVSPLVPATGGVAGVPTLDANGVPVPVGASVPQPGGVATGTPVSVYRPGSAPSTVYLPASTPAAASPVAAPAAPPVVAAPVVPLTAAQQTAADAAAAAATTAANAAQAAASTAATASAAAAETARVAAAAAEATRLQAAADAWAVAHPNG